MSMMSRLAARIEALEETCGPPRIVPRITLTVLANTEPLRPLLGYRVLAGGKAVDVTRLAAETDDELRQRAQTVLRALEGDSLSTVLLELRGD